MIDVQGKQLSDIVRIARHYQRSIRIDVDLGRDDALEGYICHGTALAALDSMSKQLRDSNQRAFTWTGPFGGENPLWPSPLPAPSGLTKSFALRSARFCRWTACLPLTRRCPRATAG